jgi:hypothetical protein
LSPTIELLRVGGDLALTPAQSVEVQDVKSTSVYTRFSARAGEIFYIRVGRTATTPGHDVELLLDSNPRTPPVFIRPVLSDGQHPAIELEVPFPRTITLERTTDFRWWYPAGSIEVPANGVVWPIPQSVDQAPQFFRATSYN